MKISACLSLLPAFALSAGGAAGAAGQADERPISSAPASAEVRVDAGARPDFSGTWRLNTDLSEDPREKIQEARGSAAAVDEAGWAAEAAAEWGAAADAAADAREVPAIPARTRPSHAWGRSRLRRC